MLFVCPGAETLVSIVLHFLFFFSGLKGQVSPLGSLLYICPITLPWVFIDLWAKSTHSEQLSLGNPPALHFVLPATCEVPWVVGHKWVSVSITLCA